jgi:hypothetical protein
VGSAHPTPTYFGYKWSVGSAHPTVLKKSNYYPNHNIEILTYDRFIEVAENLEQQDKRYKSRTIDNRDKEFLSKFSKNPEQFSVSDNRDTNRYPNELDIHGICYKIQFNGNQREPEFVVNIINSTYVILESRRSFNLFRIEPDGISLSVADNLESLRAAIELAEIYERLIHFHIDTEAEYSLNLVDECLQRLIQNPPYNFVDSIE